jgi:hypothetical protein
MKKVAFETMGFVLERVKAEAAYHNCDQTKKISAMERSIAEKQAGEEREKDRKGDWFRVPTLTTS